MLLTSAEQPVTVEVVGVEDLLALVFVFGLAAELLQLLLLLLLLLLIEVEVVINSGAVMGNESAR